MDQPIAATDVIIVRPTGQASQLSIRIFRPFADAENATCSVELAGLFDRVHNIHGEDTFQALALALRFVYRLLDSEESRGSVVHVAGSDGIEPFLWRECWSSGS